MKAIRERLDAVIEKYHLLNHPFYRAWSKGELPLESIKGYAREYGSFIKELPTGWKTLNDEHTAREEQEHFEMWCEFASYINTTVETPSYPAVKSLLQTARKLFSEPATALGALYAFEAQQPSTSSSKLQGLKTFYGITGKETRYFEEHSKNFHEVDKILNLISRVEESEHDKIVQSCEEMCKALWDALTDLTPSHILACEN